MDIVLLNMLPFLLALLMAVPTIRQTFTRRGITWLAAGVMAVLFAYLVTLIPDLEYEAITYEVKWVDDLGLSLLWYVDGLALFFALIVTGIGAMVFLYAGFYFDEVHKLGKFYTYLGAFAGSMLGVVFSGNVLTLFIAWELTSITSFLLIGFYGDKDAAARTAASRALVITGGGGLALFVGLMLMGVATNQLNGADLFATSGFEFTSILNTSLVGHDWYNAIVILVMIGAFTKSAQFPFHFWLPGAMTAPSPASAYLHSATMVKAGIYLLFRLYPTLGNTDLWQNGLIGIGLTTMFIGALFAIRKRDLKALLAYSTVSKLGAIVALIGLPEEHGLKAAVLGILAHALYKGTFFLLAGTIEHATGTRNLDHLGGLRRHLPISMWTAAAVGLSMAGFPPLVGFAAKEYLLDAMLPEGPIGVIPVIVVFVASVLTVVAALLFVWDVFISRPETTYDHFHAPEFGLHIGPAVTATMSLITGILIAPLIEPLTDVILHDHAHLHILPQEINTAVLLSVGVLILGPAIFTVRSSWLKMPWFRLPSGIELYAGTIHMVERTGDLLLKSQNGKLRYYLVAILGSVSILMVLGGFDNLSTFTVQLDRGAPDILKLMLLTLTVGATLAAIVLRRHLLAALAMGVVGYAVGGIFLLEPAPDVALVQFLVETLATVLIIVMLARIDDKQRQEAMAVLWKGRFEKTNFGLLRDAAISIVIGVNVALFALAAVNGRDERLETTDPIVNWHLENAYPETGATDVVGAIVTDFRGTDTLIEITVFAMAGLGVLTLLTLPEGPELLVGRRITGVMRGVVRQGGNDLADNQAQETKEPASLEIARENIPRSTGEMKRFDAAQQLSKLDTPLTRRASIVVLPFAMLIAFSQILYGASGPGDGFTAGVVAGLTVALWYVVFGYFEARRRLDWLAPGRLITIGLLLAIGNAIVGMVLSDGFFHLYKFGDGHGPAHIHATSTLVFEFAIFLTVFGGVTAIMEAIAHPEDVEKIDE